MITALTVLMLQAAPGAAPPAIEFRGPDGKPLPPEVERRLREQFKDGLPPARKAGDVVVTGERPRGSAIGTIPPERTLSAIDIRSYGADTVTDLIQALGAQVGSGRGREDAGPLVLLNGRRVSSSAEIARIPTEAIERTEILPEEVALGYGYPADRKVVNVVTLERFTSRIVQANGTAPTEGGQSSIGGGAHYLRLRGNSRYALDADLTRSSALLESERDVRQPSDDATLGDYRTLLPEIHRFTLGGTVAGTPRTDLSATLDGRFESTSSRALLGFGLGKPLRRDGESETAHLGTTLGGRIGKWQWTATGNLDHMTSTTLTDTGIAGAPRNDARARDRRADADMLASGSLFDLPAGAVAASLRLGVAARDFEGVSRLGSGVRVSDFQRDTALVQAHIDLPITAPSTAGPGWLGRLSVNANAGFQRLSDVGTLRSIGYGVGWAPVPAVSFLASVTQEEGAPTIEQLGAPQIVLPNIRTLDLVRGETVDVTRILGGNPTLRSDDRHVFSLGLTVQPWRRTDLALNLDYIDTRIDRPIAAFPLATPQVEAAFPDRFTRDASGRLQRIDATALNFARSTQRQLRWGISFMKPLGTMPPGMENARVRVFSSEEEARRRAPPGAQLRFERATPGSPAARRLENLTSRLMISLQHVWRLEDRVLLRPGIPELDLLNGDALDGRGGRPRHEVEGQMGVFKHGLGARVTANWQGETRLDGLGGPGGDLRFSDLATVNLNLFANLGDRWGRGPGRAWMKGMRLSLNVTNLFNARQQVRDATGATPIIYQPAYLNPLGRTVAIGLRKIL